MNQIKGYLLAIFSAISYGLIPLFIIPVKQAHLSVSVTLFYRFFLAALILLPVLIIRKEKLTFPKQEWLPYLFMGLLYGGGSDLLFISYDKLTPGIASTIFFVYPVVIALANRFIFKEKLHKGIWPVLAMILMGVFLLSQRGVGEYFSFWGIALVLLSASCSAGYMLIVNHASLKGSGWKITFYAMLFTAAYYLIRSFSSGDNIFAVTEGNLVNFLIFALVASVISMTTLTYAIKYIGSLSTGIVGAFEPVTAVLVSVVLFGEIMSIHLILGVLFIVIAVVISLILEGKKWKLPKGPKLGLGRKI